MVPHFLSIFHSSQIYTLRKWQTESFPVEAIPPYLWLESNPLQELVEILLDQMLERTASQSSEKQQRNREKQVGPHCLLGESRLLLRMFKACSLCFRSVFIPKLQSPHLWGVLFTYGPRSSTKAHFSGKISPGNGIRILDSRHVCIWELQVKYLTTPIFSFLIRNMRIAIRLTPSSVFDQAGHVTQLLRELMVSTSDIFLTSKHATQWLGNQKCYVASCGNNFGKCKMFIIIILIHSVARKIK